MQLQLIGQLLEVEPTETKNKNTGKIDQHTEIQVQFTGINEKGYNKYTTESIRLDEDYFDELDSKIGSYVCITYTVINTKTGAMYFPDDNMPVLVLDKNPLDYSKFKRDKKVSK